jgi:hypothetical protein
MVKGLLEDTDTAWRRFVPVRGKVACQQLQQASRSRLYRKRYGPWGLACWNKENSPAGTGSH